MTATNLNLCIRQHTPESFSQIEMGNSYFSVSANRVLNFHWRNLKNCPEILKNKMYMAYSFLTQTPLTVRCVICVTNSMAIVKLPRRSSAASHQRTEVIQDLKKTGTHFKIKNRCSIIIYSTKRILKIQLM